MSTKKDAQPELLVKFYLGQHEDCSPEAASQIVLRDCSKAALVNRQGGGLAVGSSIPLSSPHFTKGFFVSHEDLMSP